MRRRYLVRTATVVIAVICTLGAVSRSGVSSSARTWTWGAETTPGAALSRPVTAGGSTGLRELASAGELLLVAAVRADGVAVGATTSDTVTLTPVATVAEDSALVAFSAAAANGGGQELVGIARADIDHVAATRVDGSTVDVPLNEWRAFSYTASSQTDAAVTVAAFSAGSSVATVAVASTSTSTSTSAPAVAAGSAPAPAHLKAFDRPRESTDNLPTGVRRLVRGPQRTEAVVDSRRIASYVDGRGRAAELFLARTKTMTCLVSTWRSAAGAGCSRSSEFLLANRHLVVSSGRLIFGVASDDVARVTVVGSRGVRHPVAVTRDGGFIFDCKAYNGCPCVVDRVEAANAAGDTVQTVTFPRLASCQPTHAELASRTTNRQMRFTHGYTIANHGHEVAARGHRLFRAGASYRLFLLGVRGERAFYRVEVTPTFTCWGSGPASRIGEIGSFGCPGVVGAYPLQLDDVALALPSKSGPIRQMSLLRAGGIVADQARSVALVDGRGRRLEQAPVEDNLYAFPGPYPKTYDTAVRVVALDEHGDPLAPHPEWGEHQTPPTGVFGPRAHRVNPITAGTPVQHGAAQGVSVTRDNRGVVVFDSSAIDRGRLSLLRGRRVGFSCFYVQGQNYRHIWAGGISTAWRPHVALKTPRHPFDGCELQGSYGHRWHDSRGPHGAVEVPLTERGRRYFEARAAARDLALFVRSKKMQQIRGLSGDRLLAGIRRTYGNRIAVLDSVAASAAPETVGVAVSATTAVFSERSSTGVRFYVEVRNGKVAAENVRGLAYVF